MVVEHELSPSEQQGISERLELDLLKCEDEIALLSYDSALSNLPDGVLLMMTGVAENGISTNFDDGFTPLHWAAKNGRRDIMEFLLRLDGGRNMLSMRDKFGRAPLFYVQQTQKQGLEDWLAQQLVVGTESGVDPRMSIISPVKPLDGRPSLGSVPRQYEAVLEQIERHGWRSMNWKDGFTMLHWAAQKGHTDVAKYLIQLEADPLALDAQNRTPIDVAREHGNTELASVLAASSRRSFSLGFIPT
jgi:ankyrin repeat protein